MRRTVFPYIIFLMAVIAVCCHALAGEYGLRIKGDSYNVQENTTLVLSPDKPIKLYDDMVLTFSMTVRKEPVFGNILSLTFDNDSTVYCIIRRVSADSVRLALKYGDSLIEHPILFGFDTPVQVTLLMERYKRCLSLATGGDSLRLPLSIDACRNVRISFGRPLGRFENHEVAPVDIQDIKILGEGDRLLHVWELRQHTDSVCYDSVGGVKALAIHGHWLLDDHIRMKRIWHIRGNGLWQTAYDSAADEFLATDGKIVRRFRPESSDTVSEPGVGGMRAMPYSNNLLVLPADGTLYSYDLTSGQVSRYDTLAHSFGTLPGNSDQSHHYNHSVAFADSATVYTFGGYGFFRYSNELFRVRPGEGSVERVDYTPVIPPRNSAAACIVDGKMYIFGGFGNESGLQELDCQYFYDMYCIDLTTMRSSLLWRAEAPENDFIVTSSMVWNPTDSSFYVGTTSPDGAIARVYRNRPHWEFVTEKTDCEFSYRDFTFDLYRSDKRMYLVIDKRVDGDLHDISVYSVDLPLMASAQIEQTLPERSGGAHIWWFVVCGILIAGCVAAYRMRRSRHRVERTFEEAVAGDVLGVDEAAGASAPGSDEAKALRANSITLLGEFRIVDREGVDITGQFTPLLRNLLVIFLLYSREGGKGVAKESLDATLWGGMDRKKAQANRQVNISRLRMLLKSLDGIEIWKDSMSFGVSVTAACRVDYYESCAAMNDADGTSAQDILALYASPLLPDVPTEWLDPFKSAYSARVINMLSRVCRTAAVAEEWGTVELGASALLRHDPFSEPALQMLCHALFMQRRPGVAKTVYERFCRLYSEAFGDVFATPFADLYR